MLILTRGERLKRGEKLKAEARGGSPVGLEELVGRVQLPDGQHVVDEFRVRVDEALGEQGLRLGRLRTQIRFRQQPLVRLRTRIRLRQQQLGTQVGCRQQPLEL